MTIAIAAAGVQATDVVETRPPSGAARSLPRVQRTPHGRFNARQDVDDSRERRSPGGRTVSRGPRPCQLLAETCLHLIGHQVVEVHILVPIERPPTRGKVWGRDAVTAFPFASDGI